MKRKAVASTVEETRKRNCTQKISPSHRKYDVFISFRGEDTRYKFTKSLFEALRKEGIDTFRDDKELERGKSIAPELLTAIEFSRISIVVLSTNYASSKWCLEELVKIVDCRKTMEQIVIPIFYDVDPSIVRNQTGCFQEPFAKYEVKEDIRKVQKWKGALTEVAAIAGFDSRNRCESDLVNEIVRDVLDKLSPSTDTKYEDLVGMNSRLKKLKDLITTEMPNDVCAIGIYGTEGIGKTTLARVFAEVISHEFDGKSFLANIREKSEKDEGLVFLQNQLLSNLLPDDAKINIWNIDDGVDMISKKLQRKKALIILDDVDDEKQIKYLVRKRNWFGSGSLIILTTRNEHLLKYYEVDAKYRVEELNHDEARQLLRLKAFESHLPSKDFCTLSDDIVKYCCGLPLVLEVVGSSLIGKSKEVWGEILERLKIRGSTKILGVLEISFNGLEDIDKEIFLDIACFFKGYDKDYVTRILKGCQFNPILGIENLIERSLITILYGNQLWMHDLLQDMGRRIVKKESREPGERSRIWEKEDISNVLRNNTGTKNVQGIMCGEELNLEANAKSFSEMKNLRLLKIRGVKLEKGIEYLSNNLCLLEWPGYPLKSLPPNLQLDKIVELDLSYSNIEKLWDGIQSSNLQLDGIFKLDLSYSKIEELWDGIASLKELKSINLRNCSNLTATPDLTGAPNLETLDLDGCTKLREIHPSLLVHNKITHLCMRNFTNLTTFPRKVCMESLQSLDLSGCSKLVSKEEEILGELDITGTAIKQPQSNIFVRNINKIIRWYGGSSNSMGFKLPSLLGCHSLTRLSLRGCNIGEGGIPPYIGELGNLLELDLSNNNFVSLPESLSGLRHLKILLLMNCKNLQSLSVVPKPEALLDVSGCVSLERSSDALRLSTWNKHGTFVFAVNCPNFLGDNMNTVFFMLKDYMQHPSQLHMFKGTFQITFPGSIILEWFHQKEGSLITLRRHPYFYKDCNLIGYVVCCVFVVHKHPPIVTRPRDGTHRLNLSISSAPVPGCYFEENSGQVMSEHTWLVFVPEFSGTEDISMTLKCEFRIQFGPGLEIKRCGACPIYKQDIDDQFNQSNDFNPWNLNKFLDEAFDGSTVEEEDESEYYRCFSLDKPKKAAAISYLDAHPSRLIEPYLKDDLRPSLGVLVHIYTISKSNYDAAESNPFSRSNIIDEDYIAYMNFLDILVPELKDYIRSIMGVNTSIGSHPDSDEGQSSGSGNDDGEAQPKRLRLGMSLTEARGQRGLLPFLYISFKGSKQDLESIRNKDSLLKIACQTKIDIIVDEGFHFDDPFRLQCFKSGLTKLMAYFKNSQSP